jgi:hypothetical protein
MTSGRLQNTVYEKTHWARDRVLLLGGAPFAEETNVEELDKTHRASDGFLYITMALTGSRADAHGSGEAVLEAAVAICKIASVQCPICQAYMPEKDINQHIDEMHQESLLEPFAKRRCTSQQSAPIEVTDEDPAALHPEGTVQSENPQNGVTETTDSPAPELAEPERKQVDSRSIAQPTHDDAHVSSSTACANPQQAPATLLPEEHLKASLIGSSTHSLRCARADSTQAHGRILKMCTDNSQMLEQHRQKFEEYAAMSKPSDRAQQCARNVMRCDLENVAKMLQVNLQLATAALDEPGDRVRKARAAKLDRIDGAIHMLQDLRARTLEDYLQCQEDQAAQRCECEAAIAALKSPLNYVDTFVHQLAHEVTEETTKAIKVHTEKLEDLQQEQMRFVNANDSPQSNPIFAKVIDDLASTQRVLEEHAEQQAAYESLLKDWEQAMRSIPEQREADAAPSPRKRTFWSRVLGCA